MTIFNQNITSTRRVVDPPKPEMGSGMSINYGIQNQVGACGIGNAYSFSEWNLSRYTKQQASQHLESYTKEGVHYRSGGCGFLSAAFIDTPACKAVFKHLKDLFPILYQSPIRFNVNSGNNFFFVIFDTGEKEKPSEYTDPDHAVYDENHNPGFKDGLEW